MRATQKSKNQTDVLGVARIGKIEHQWFGWNFVNWNRMSNRANGSNRPCDVRADNGNLGPFFARSMQTLKECPG